MPEVAVDDQSVAHDRITAAAAECAEETQMFARLVESAGEPPPG